MPYQRSVNIIRSPNAMRRANAFRGHPNTRPMLVTPKVAQLMGLGDYTTQNPTTGALVAYGGSSPGTISPTPVPASPAASSYPDGTVLQASGSQDIYLVSGGILHGFPNMQTFDALGYTPALITPVTQSVINSYRVGNPVATPVVPASVTSATTTTATNSVAGTVSAVLEPGAVYNSSTGYYTNPDGSIYYAATSSGNYVSTTPTYNATLEAGAVYDASTGMYTNPDGTIYDPSLAASATVTTTFDITEPSTWPTWVWLAAAAGGTWLLFLRRR